MNVMKGEALRQHTRYTQWSIGSLTPSTSGNEDSYLDLATAIHNYGKLKVDSLKLDWLKNITAKKCADLYPLYDEEDED